MQKLLHILDQPLIYKNKTSIRVWSNAYSQSNGIPSELTNHFIFPEFITEETKQNAYDKLQTKNIFGGAFEYGAEIIFSPDSNWQADGSHLSFGFRNQILTSGSLGSDAFRLLFGGNAAFADQTVDLSGIEYYSMHFETYEFGYLKTAPKSMFSIRFGLVRARSYNHLSTRNSSIFTSSDGSFLDLSWNGSLSSSSESSNQWKNAPSLGASLNMEFTQSIGSKWLLRERLNDFGFVSLNSATQLYQFDTSLVFTGIQLGNILDINDSTIVVGDSLAQVLRGQDIRGTSMIALPVKFELELTRLFRNNWLAGASVSYRYLPGMQPLGTITIGKLFANHRSVRLNISYGGFGKLQTSISALLFSNNHHSISLGTYFNEGFINASKLSGNGFKLNYVHHL